MAGMKSIRLGCILPAVMSAALFIGEGHALSGFPNSQVSASGSTATQGDGYHDFDFLIGDWKAHVLRLPERLQGSNVWVEYDGVSNHKKLLDSNANFEEFDVSSPDNKLRIKAQTLRLYNPESHQWSIYLVDLDKGTLDLPPVVGQFNGKRGEFYNQQNLGRPRSPCALCLAQHFTQIIANGTVFFVRRRKDMESQLGM
jgi:hypothetical protein